MDITMGFCLNKLKRVRQLIAGIVSILGLIEFSQMPSMPSDYFR